jgi:ubiquitin-protein ligase
MSVRLLRLQAEYERLLKLFSDHERIRIAESVGNPPDRYVIEYKVRGLVEEKSEVKEQLVHRAEITLGPNYPRERPRCVMLTPVFHPNIDHLAICTEDIRSAGQTLDQTIVFIGEMIAYQAYNLQSPRNGDAARWTTEHLNELPLEGTDLVPQLLTQGVADSEFPLTAPAWVQPVVTSVEPAFDTIETVSAQSAPSLRPESQLSMCANCRRSLAPSELQRCANKHFVCGDCLLACQNCRQTLCVLCDARQCSNCRGLFCPDCRIFCQGCQSLTCVAHIRQCQLCSRWHCMKSCARFCELCGLSCCQEHLDSANRCPKCVTDKPAATVANEDVLVGRPGPQ